MKLYFLIILKNIGYLKCYIWIIRFFFYLVIVCYDYVMVLNIWLVWLIYVIMFSDCYNDLFNK